MTDREPEPDSAPPEVGDALGEDPRLWQALRDGTDAAARERLIDAHRKLVRIIAAKVLAMVGNPSLDIRDLIQCGSVGLMAAVDRFDHTRGVRFSTFASKRIRGEMLNYIELDSEAASQSAFRRRVRSERVKSLRPRRGGADAQIFEELVDVAVGLAVGFMLEDTGMLVASDAQTAEAADPLTQLMMADRIQQLAARLPDAEARVVRYHYLLEMDFTSIAQLMKLSQPRISQLHAQALRHLRAMYAERHLMDTYV